MTYPQALADPRIPIHVLACELEPCFSRSPIAVLHNAIVAVVTGAAGVA